MKMNLKYVLLACGLVMGLASCSNEEQGEVTPVEGEKTYAQIGLAYETKNTRGYTTEDAVGNEAKITDGKIYVFNSNKVLEKVVDYKEGTQCRFETTTGKHYFLAMANAPAEALIPIGTHMENMAKYLQDINKAKFETYTTGNTKGFFMTSGVDMVTGGYAKIEYVDLNIVKATEKQIIDDGLLENPQLNYIPIPVGRAMAKVQVRLTLEAGELNNTTEGDAKGEVKIENLEYLITNNPDRMYSFPYFGGIGLNLFQTPSFDIYDENSAPSTYWPALHTITKDDYVKPADKTKPAAFYAMENSNLYPSYSDATILSVKAIFTPSHTYNDKDDLSTPTTVTPGSKIDFWRVLDKGSKKYLDKFCGSEEVAEAVAKAKGLTEYTLVKYEKGLCYYIIPLYDNQKKAPECYDVVRNHYYDVNINEIMACGYNTPGGDEFTEPKDPLDPKDVWMHAAITVKSWVKVSQTGGLGPRN